METDASVHAVGTVLLQSEVEEEYPTLFNSEALNAGQPKYSTYEGDLCSEVQACYAFKVYLLCRELILRTVHPAHSAIFNSHLSSRSRVAKCLLALHPYRFRVMQITGEENVAADKL